MNNPPQPNATYQGTIKFSIGENLFDLNGKRGFAVRKGNMYLFTLAGFPPHDDNWTFRVEIRNVRLD